MSIKTDGERRWVELEFLLPGTPEEVWRAIATGPGISAWFAPTTVEEHVGGKVHFEFGEGVTSTGIVTAWEPGSRLAYEERDWSGDAPPLASEFVITSHPGNRCVVRLVHTLFTSKDSWDDEVEGFERGWRGFFEVLRAYLQHFSGQNAGAARAVSVHPGPHARAWKELTTGLGLWGPNLGEQRSTSTGAPRLVGTIESVHQDAEVCEVMLRLEQPAPGLALIGSYPSAGKARVAASVFFYGPGATAAAAELEPQCRTWFNEHFPNDEAS
jgi:uncharacterized protein YndB with AHSA1/START domain